MNNSHGRYDTTIYVERDTEIEVRVSGDVTPVRRGRYSGPPETCFPDEGGEIDIIAAYVIGSAGSASTGAWANGQPFELLGTEIELATDALWKAANDEWEAATEEAAIARYEARYEYCDRT